ncbi:hypothetical protein EBB07_04415 [Paenibacillaceae bacterium]|nr:hypothetical protein EBB07_04415 [Paenibacillaceae bacterium]
MTELQLHSLLKEMTLSEKIAQLLQLAPAFYEGANRKGQITGPHCKRDSGQFAALVGPNSRDVQELTFYLKA